MEALADPIIHVNVVYGSNYEIKDTLIDRVRRRVDRDKVFDRVLRATVIKKPAVKRIQEQFASQFGFKFKE